MTEQPIRILYVDDNPHDRTLIRDALEQSDINFELTDIDTREAFESCLENGQAWNLVLSDFNILGFTGLQALEHVQRKRPDLPVVIVTGTGSEEVAVKAMRGGAADYVIKTPGHIRSLPHVILKVLEHQRMELEHRRMIGHLKESEARFRLLAENTLDCIWQMDMHFTFTYINPVIEDMFGFTPEEWIGSTMGEHCDAGELGQMKGIIQQEMENLEDHSGVQFETVMRRKDGSPIPVEIRGRILLDENGRPEAMQGITRDIRERKEMEEKQRQQLIELQQAQKMEAVGRLAGGVAHDFNNMLNVILGYTEMAATRLPEDHPVQDYVKRVLDAASKSANLTRQLLAFSRKEDIEPKTVNINELVEGNLKMLTRLIGEHIDLTFEPEPDLWDIRVDPSQMDQILANLCINARDAMENGGAITIKTRRLTQSDSQDDIRPLLAPGDYVEMTVRDTGCGMDTELLTKIFEPFFTTKEAGKGTGLGLSTVYGIVQQSGGFISADSKPGEGTTFHLFFPRCTDSTEMVNHAESEDSFEGGETILIVEDEQEVLDVATRALEMYGYTVLTAGTPGRAIEIASGNADIDLLLSDVVMPGMNGHELQKQIQALRPVIRTLFMSGYTADVIEEHGGTGESEYLIHKPFTIQDLVQKVRLTLDAPPQPESINR